MLLLKVWLHQLPARKPYPLHGGLASDQCLSLLYGARGLVRWLLETLKIWVSLRQAMSITDILPMLITLVSFLSRPWWLVL